MKRFFAIACSLLILCSLAGCHTISIDYDGEAVLTCETKRITNRIEEQLVIETLTAEETRMVKKYLSSAKYEADGAGCPFDKNVSIAFGDRVFAIGFDSCGAVRDVTMNEDYGLSKEGIAYINSLFEKYVGCHPVH